MAENNEAVMQAGDDAEFQGGQDEGSMAAPARQSHKNIRGRDYFSSNNMSNEENDK